MDEICIIQNFLKTLMPVVITTRIVGQVTTNSMAEACHTKSWDCTLNWIFFVKLRSFSQICCRMFRIIFITIALSLFFYKTQISVLYVFRNTTSWLVRECEFQFHNPCAYQVLPRPSALNPQEHSCGGSLMSLVMPSPFLEGFSFK